MPRTVSGPAWLEAGRLAGYVALALAESAHDRVRMRRVLQHLGEGAPADVRVPAAEAVGTDLGRALEAMQRGGGDPRRARLVQLVAVEGLARHEVAERLHLSERQFYRVRQEAAEELADELTALWRAGSVSAPARPRPAGERLPVSPSFVGRVAELEEATQLLRAHGTLLIGGPPGIGKTALGAQVVSIEADRFATAWHRFRPGLSDSPAAVLLTLARALANNGDSRLEELVGGSGATLWLPGAIDLAKRSIGDAAWLLWFDDTDVIVENPDVCALIQLLAEECPDVRILLTGRAELWRLPEVSRLVLAGMRPSEVREMLETFGLGSLATSAVDRLIEATGGSPQLLRLAANLVSSSARPDLVIEDIAAEPDVGSFLLHNVWQQLGEDQRELLRGASLLRGPVTAAFLARAFSSLAESVPDSLVRLAQQFLLAGSDGGLRLHSSLRLFCRRQLSGSRESELHDLLARAFAADGDTLEACHHWLEAGRLRDARDAVVTWRWHELGADKRVAVAEVTERLIEELERPGDELLAVHAGLLRALGREHAARDALMAHATEIRDGTLVLSLAELQRRAGSPAAARAALSGRLSSTLATRDRWRLWWALARLEQDDGDVTGALRAAERMVETADDDHQAMARAARAAVRLAPDSQRLNPPQLDRDAADVAAGALRLDPAGEDEIVVQLARAAVSAGHGSADGLVRRLRELTALPTVQGHAWWVEAVASAASGDYRKAGAAMWRCAERLATVGDVRGGAAAARTAALYRVMAGDPAAAQAHLDWSESHVPGHDAVLVAVVDAVRWLRSRSGAPPTVSGPVVANALGLLVRAAAGGGDVVAAVADAIGCSAGVAADMRMVILDSALALAPDEAAEAERRDRRLGLSAGGRA